MIAAPAMPMQDLELEQAGLLPARETLTGFAQWRLRQHGPGRAAEHRRRERQLHNILSVGSGSIYAWRRPGPLACA